MRKPTFGHMVRRSVSTVCKTSMCVLCGAYQALHHFASLFLSLFQPPLRECLNLLNKYKHMVGMIFRFMSPSLTECPLNPSVCVGGIIPQTPGCIAMFDLKMGGNVDFALLLLQTGGVSVSMLTKMCGEKQARVVQKIELLLACRTIRFITNRHLEAINQVNTFVIYTSFNYSLSISPTL